MLIVKIDNKTTLDKALKIYKSKVIQSRQSSELNNRKEFEKKSVKRRMQIRKAQYVQQKYRNDN